MAHTRSARSDRRRGARRVGRKHQPTCCFMRGPPRADDLGTVWRQRRGCAVCLLTELVVLLAIAKRTIGPTSDHKPLYFEHRPVFLCVRGAWPSSTPATLASDGAFLAARHARRAGFAMAVSARDETNRADGLGQKPLVLDELVARAAQPLDDHAAGEPKQPRTVGRAPLRAGSTVARSSACSAARRPTRTTSPLRACLRDVPLTRRGV